MNVDGSLVTFSVDSSVEESVKHAPLKYDGTGSKGVCFARNIQETHEVELVHPQEGLEDVYEVSQFRIELRQFRLRAKSVVGPALLWMKSSEEKSRARLTAYNTVFNESV